MTFNVRWISILALLILLVGCGGGGGDATESASTDNAPAETTDSDSATPAAATSEPMGTSSVSGTVTFSGEVPNLPPQQMDADPGCAAKHSTDVPSDALVLGEGNTMANILVRVTEGLPAVNFAPPAEPAVLDQNGCRYEPHVLGVMAGQQLKILNSDGLMHNVHALPKENKEFNMAMPATVTESIKQFDVAEEPFKIKCDVHPWMGAWVLVSEHPYFDVTAEDGAFSIEGLPAGTYTIEAWHERLGKQTASVTVGEGEAVSNNFTFSR